MELRVCIHDARDEDGDDGYRGWEFSHLGFAAWAETEDELLSDLPAGLTEYRQFRQRHGLSGVSASAVTDADVRVVERVVGNEIVFSSDFAPADANLIDETIALLGASRAELLGLLREAPGDLFDWDPPFPHVRNWSYWRTVRQILAHIANTETHYYLPSIGIRPDATPVTMEGAWQDQLDTHRGVTTNSLRDLKSSKDLSRVDFREEGAWSVRKVLRRLVWHERLHAHHVQSIIAAYSSQDATSSAT